MPPVTPSNRETGVSKRGILVHADAAEVQSEGSASRFCLRVVVSVLWSEGYAVVRFQLGILSCLLAGCVTQPTAPDPRLALGLPKAAEARTPAGMMLRIGVDPQGERPYTIPADNPFVGDARTLPEIWALGLRNPWRYSFTPTGRLIAGDVGQNLWEEITFVGRGDNLGWRRREANQCFPPGTACDPQGLVDPVYVYGRDDGASVTGGYVYTGSEVPDLKDKYVFGDFASGRLWALDLQAPQEALALGQWGIYPATFGVGHAGELYVGDFREGRILQIRSGR